MERQRVWIILGIALCFGLGLKVLKSGSGVVRIAGLTAVNGILDDGQAVYQPGADTEYKSPIDPDLGAAVSPPSPKVITAAAIQSAPLTPSEAPKKIEKKKDDKKKPDAKKKKKKKKSKIKSGSPFQPNQSQATGEDKKPVASGAGIVPSLSSGTVTNGPAIDPVTGEALPVTAKEWEDYLLNAADMDRTEKFIRAYQSGSVKSDVFYEVVNSMLDSSNQDIKKLGVMALGATPSLRSFELLSMVSHTATFPSLARTQATVYLRVYSRLENLKVLIAVLAKQDSVNPTPAIDAVQLIKKSADTYLQPAAVATSVSPRTLTAALATRYFAPVLTALKTAAKYPNKIVVTTAASVYSQIAVLMPSTSSTLPPVASTNPVISNPTTSP